MTDGETAAVKTVRMMNDGEQLAPKECDHERLEHKGTDTDGAPDAVYEEWRCEDCGSLVSDVYMHAGHRIIQTPDDEVYEEQVAA